MKSIFTAGLFGLCCLPAMAQTTYSYTDLPVLIQASEVAPDSQATFGRKEAIDSTIAVSPRSVKLNADVTFGAAANSVKFNAGQVLFGRYEHTVWTYCGISNMTAASAGLNMLFLQIPDKQIACLHDADDDGVFDTGWSGGDAIDGTNMAAFSLYGPRTLSAQPSYEHVAPEQGPGMPVELTWAKSRKSGVIAFSLEVSGRRIAQTAAAIPAKGSAPATFSISGAQYELSAYDAKEKSVTIKVLKPLSRRFTTLKATRVTTMRTTYVPVYR